MSLKKLAERKRARLAELKVQMENGEVRSEDLATVQAEVASLNEDLTEIAEAQAEETVAGGENRADKADDTKEDKQDETEKAKDEDEKEDEDKAKHLKDDEQRSAILAAIGSALSTKNADPAKRNEKEVRSAFANFVVGRISEGEARSLGIETGNGSVTVPEVIASEVITYAQEENLLRKYGTVHKTKGDVKYPVLVKKMDANVRKKERGIGDEIENTGIEFDEILLSPAEFDALATVTKKLLKMSGAPVEKIVIDELKKAYVRKETNYMFNGDDAGNENPGALAKKAVGYYEKVAVEIEKEGWSQRLYAELVKMKNQPVTEVLKKSMWIVNRAALTLLESMVDATGRPLLHVDATDGVTYKLLGHKLDFTDAADAKDSGTPVFYFGDFKAFHIQDVVSSMEIQKLVEKYASTNRIGFQIYNLLDGQLVYSPFEPAVYRYEVGAKAPEGGGAKPDAPSSTEQEEPTPQPVVELRALKQADVTKREDNTSDTFTVATDGTLTTNRALTFDDNADKVVAFLPEAATELVFTGANNQHNIIVAYDGAKDNVVGVTIGNTQAGIQVYNLNITKTDGAITNLVKVSQFTNNHTYAPTTNQYKYEIKDGGVVVSYKAASEQAFTEWFKVNKTLYPDLKLDNLKFGVVGGISKANETTKTLLGKAQINVQ